METFFQANLSILPRLIETILNFEYLDAQTVFLDLYGGVGLFGVSMADSAQRVVLIEENVHSVRCARRTLEFNGIRNMEVVEGRMEETFAALSARIDPEGTVAMIDPPRAGLGRTVSEMLSRGSPFKALLYLSCNPQTLISDLQTILGPGAYKVRTVIPFDFFPRTRHLETLAVLTPR